MQKRKNFDEKHKNLMKNLNKTDTKSGKNRNIINDTKLTKFNTKSEKDMNIIHTKSTKKALKAVIAIIVIAVIALVGVAVWFAVFKDKVKVNLDNEGVVEVKNITFGKEYSLGLPTKTGYSFVAWFDSQKNGTALTNNLGEGNNRIWSQKGNSTVYARWIANNYKIDLDYNGATGGNSVTQVDCVYDEQIAHFPIPTKENYEFLGWFTQSTGGVKVSDSLGIPTAEYAIYKAPNYTADINIDNATKLFARWSVGKVTVSFEPNGGSPVADAEYESGNIINEMPLTGMNQKTFVGWCDDFLLNNLISFPYTIPSGSKTIKLYAKYIDSTFECFTFTPINGEREYSVSLVDGNKDILIIPDMYYGKKITKIGNFANSNASQIILPQTVASFQQSAFENCANLKSINIPFAVTSLPNKLFKDCVKLDNIVFPQNLRSIGDDVFFNCQSLSSLNITAKINSIGASAFVNLTNLAKITVDEKNSTFVAIDDVLFKKYGSNLHLVTYAMSKSNTTYKIPENVIKIMEYAFAGAINLKTLTIENKVVSIGDFAFSGCFNLIKIEVTLDATASGQSPSIGANAFENCVKLKSVLMRNTRPPMLGANAFKNTSSLFTVYVPTDSLSNYASYAKWSEYKNSTFGLSTVFGDFALMDYDNEYAIRQYLGDDATVIVPEIINGKKIVAINDKAFADNDSLKSITLSKYIINISNAVFVNCLNIESVYINAIDPPTLSYNAFSNTNLTFNIFVENDMTVVNNYKIATNWSVFADRIFSKN